MTTRLPTIHVIDDDILFRNAVARLLDEAGYQVKDYASAAAFLEKDLNCGPGCILLDLEMPEVGGLELQERLNKLDSILPIVFLSGYGDISTGVRAIKAGAEDFLSKPVPKEKLLDAISRALARYEHAKLRDDSLNSARSLLASLTPREGEVLASLMRGMLHKQIAYELGLSDRTIKLHRHNILAKLQVRSLAEAILVAERARLHGDRNSSK